MLSVVRFGTPSAEAREAAALELLGKLEASRLHDPESAAAKRRCLEEWRRLVADLPPGNSQCSVQLLRPSWSTLRPPSECLSLLLRPSSSTLRPPSECLSLSTSHLRLQCTPHKHPLWKSSCGKTCALSPASDAEQGKVLYSVPLSRHMGCCWRAQIPVLNLREACPFCGSSNLSDSGFFALHQNAQQH